MLSPRNHTIACAAVLTGLATSPSAAQDQAAPAAVPAPFSLVLSTTGLPVEGRWKSTPLVTDLNQDGFMDLVLHPRLGRGTHVFLGDGKGNWTDTSDGVASPANTTCGGSVEVADLNKDGHPDLTVADHCDGVNVVLADGKGGWKVVTEYMNPREAALHMEDGENPWSGAESMAVGDVNEDGSLDLVVAGSDRGGFAIYLGDGTGSTWKEQPPSGLPHTDDPGEGASDGGGWSREVLLRDMNGDQHLDVIASYHRGPRVWLGDGKGQFRWASEGFPSPLVYGVFQQISVSDVNNDGRPDVLAANTVNGPEVYLQNADGTWKHAGDVMPSMWGGAMAVTAGDFDGDGWNDLLVGGRADRSGRYGLFILRNDGHGGWIRLATEMPADGQQVVWGVTAADVNGDNRVDVIASLGGAMGAGAGRPGTPDSETLPHVQVWLNQPK